MSEESNGGFNLISSEMIKSENYDQVISQNEETKVVTPRQETQEHAPETERTMKTMIIKSDAEMSEGGRFSGDVSEDNISNDPRVRDDSPLTKDRLYQARETFADFIFNRK
jgi:hypothetical protein